jgi:hypothetical protein
MPCGCKTTQQVAIGNSTIAALTNFSETLNDILSALRPGGELEIESNEFSVGEGDTTGGSAFRRLVFTAVGGTSVVNGVDLTEGQIVFEVQFLGDILPEITFTVTSGTLRLDTVRA